MASMVAHSCKPSNQERQAGKPKLEAKAGKSEASPGYTVTPYLKLKGKKAEMNENGGEKKETEYGGTCA